ncbi:MAG TPA: hypothetical protein VJT73_15795 [Polyangiaceae bacterium]|nr:hypothetical protein [Polyangiaceae bacterium]
MSKIDAEKRSTNANEGEGNKTAARRYNGGVAKTVKEGHIEEKAREAAEALDGAESDELRRAESQVKGHAPAASPDRRH